MLAVPAVIALISGAGLIVALVEDGVLDAVGGAAVGLPLAIMAWTYLRPR